MCTPALCQSEIALYDIDRQRLEDSEIILQAINKNVNNGRAVIKTYLGVENRKAVSYTHLWRPDLLPCEM